jgi:hypothetical protein
MKVRMPQHSLVPQGPTQGLEMCPPGQHPSAAAAAATAAAAAAAGTAPVGAKGAKGDGKGKKVQLKGRR